MATAEDRMPGGGPGGGDAADAVRIRPACLEDVPAVAAIEALAFSNPWHPRTFQSLIAQGRAHILVAETDLSGVVGYAILWWALDQGELANLAVTEGFRGRGIGGALLDRVLEDARANGVSSLFLEVRESNTRARALYFSRGFSEIGLRKDYYRKPREDARILSMNLAPGDAPAP